MVYYSFSTFPSKFSCCISWSLFPIPIKAQGCDSCSVQPSRSICSFFFFHPLPMRYTHGGGQKNLKINNTLWNYTVFQINTLMHTQCFYIHTLHLNLCRHALHLSWRFWKKEKEKSAADTPPLRIFPVQYMSGNSLHLSETSYKEILKERKKGLTSYSSLQVLNMMQQLTYREQFPKLI